MVDRFKLLIIVHLTSTLGFDAIAITDVDVDVGGDSSFFTIVATVVECYWGVLCSFIVLFFISILIINLEYIRYNISIIYHCKGIALFLSITNNIKLKKINIGIIK